MWTVDIVPRSRRFLGSLGSETPGFQVRWRCGDDEDWIEPDLLWSAERGLAESMARRVERALADRNVDGRSEHDVLEALWR